MSHNPSDFETANKLFQVPIELSLAQYYSRHVECPVCPDPSLCKLVERSRAAPMGWLESEPTHGAR
jgi:hypothetical protein